MIALIVPTRGLIHAPTVNTILRLDPYVGPIIIESGLPIPDCFNVPIERIMSSKNAYLYDKIMILEEDIELGDSEIKALFEAAEEHPVVAVDYHVPGSTVSKIISGIQMVGTGAIIIDRSVFETLGKPYFRTDTRYDAQDMRPIKLENAYGGHDIDFAIRCKAAGIPIYVLPEVQATHYHVVKYGEREVNNGVHTIRRVE